MANISLVLEGGKELQAALDRLEKKTGNKIVRSALRDSQNIMKNTAKSNALSIVGGTMGKSISKAIQVRTGKKRMRGSYLIQVSLKNDPSFIHLSKTKKIEKGKNKGQAVRYYIPAAIEYGHITPKGGFVQPMSYLRSADTSTRQQRIDNFNNKVIDGIAQLGKAK